MNEFKTVWSPEVVVPITAEQEELALVTAALEQRRIDSPLEFMELLPIQQRFDKSVALIQLILGGNRCLGGECEIYDPHKGIMRRIDSIDDDWFWVEAWDGKKKVEARAWRPFKKEIDDLYEIGLSNGNSFTASLNHLVLTSFGYLSIFDCLLKCGGVLQQTNLEPSQLVHALDVSDYSGKLGGYKDDYHRAACLYDVLPQLEEGIDQVPSLSPDDVQKHIFYGDVEHKDDVESKLKYNHPYLLNDHLSNLDVLRHSSGQFSDTLCRAFYILYKSVLHLRLSDYQSTLASYLRRSIVLFLQRGIELRSKSPYSITSYLAITSIHYKRRDVKWDFEVETHHNYFLAGAIHHNSGKTTPASYKVLRMGLSRRMNIWICGETFQDSIAIQQKKISELVPRRRVRYGSYDDINGYTNRKLQLDNGTLFTFKSYDQGREAFQGADIDIIWCDEEPPLEIIKEMRMRLVDRNGILIITMTSLKGITDFIRDFFEDCDVLETRFAHLVKKELPVRAKKGQVDIFFLWTTDNQHIDQVRLMDDIALMPETDILTRIYGMPTNLAGKIYMSFGRDTHVISLDDVPTSGNQLWNVLDPHDRKPWAIGWYLVNKNETVYCIAEYPDGSQPGGNFNDMLYDDKTYEDYALLIKQQETSIRQLFNCGGRVRRIVDPNFGNKTIQFAERKGGQSKTTPVAELRKLGLIYKDGIDTLEAGHLEVRKWLHWVKKDRQFIVAPRFLLADNCKNHINHLTRYSRKDIIGVDGDVKDKVAPQQKYKDFPDLVRYLLMANPRWIEENQVFKPVFKKAY